MAEPQSRSRTPHPHTDPPPPEQQYTEDQPRSHTEHQSPPQYETPFAPFDTVYDHGTSSQPEPSQFQPAVQSAALDLVSQLFGQVL